MAAPRYGRGRRHPGVGSRERFDQLEARNETIGHALDPRRPDREAIPAAIGEREARLNGSGDG